MQLNIGCGESKLQGYTNLDIINIPGIVEPDVIYDGENFPFGDNSAERIIALHVIEHISNRKHRDFFDEIWRVLITDGELFITYPNWEVCAKYFIDNHKGKRDYWLQCLYGRQLWKGDIHIAAIIVANLENELYNCGFKDIKTSLQDYNASTFCRKGERLPYYEAMY